MRICSTWEVEGRRVFITALVAALAVLGALLWLRGGDRRPGATPDDASATAPTGERRADGLVYRFEVGEIYRYTVNALMQGTLTAGGSAAAYREDVSAVVSVTPTSVDDDGVVTATVEQSSGRSVVNGQEAALIPESATVRIRSDGAIVAVSNPFGSAILHEAMLGFPGVNQFLPVLAPGRVDEGQSWTASVLQELPDVDAALSFETASTLVGPEAPPGGRVVVVRSYVDVPLDVRFDAEPGLSTENVDIPSGSAPTVVFSGSAALDTTVEFDRDRGALETMNSSGDLDMTVRYQDFPPDAGGATSLRFSGWIGFSVRESSS